MPSSSSQTKNWCFTFNNYTDADCERFALLPNFQIKYLIYGKETGESGTPHLQGFVHFKARKRMSGVKSALGSSTIHVEPARNVAKAVEYCKKDGDWFEFGDMDEVSSQGSRNDLEEFKATVKAGNCNLVSLRDLHSNVFAKYPRFCNDYVIDNAPLPVLPYYPLRNWQQDLYQRCILPPDDRKIVFVVDLVGKSGKSWFAQYYCRMHANAQILVPGKKMDMALVLRTDIRCLFLDAPRSKQGDFIQYDFLEEVKNGYVACYKYESRMKTLENVHVVVMMNELPDYSKLSVDRYDVININ